MDQNKILCCKSLDELLHVEGNGEFPNNSDSETYISRYTQLAKKFKNFPVEKGAILNSVQQWLDNMKTELARINATEDKTEREREINQLFEDDPIIFLNRHDESHTKKVMERALDLIKCFNNVSFCGYEIYLLLCAIVVHDIGNIYGRAGHEKKLAQILEKNCTSIIPDSMERRVISRIAGVHGGSIRGNRDTISVLKKATPVYGCDVKEQLLAAVLRFADELADDATRADYDAMESKIIGPASEIYHVYSSKLHTVKIQKNEVACEYEVHLAYQFDSDVAKTQYEKAGQKKYLLDEIYDRTIKMERERRYCIRYFRPYCSLERIVVEIVITKNIFDEERIPYTLEEKGYPAAPFTTIKDVNNSIMSGEEFVATL